MLQLRYSCKERVWLCTHFSYILSCSVLGTFCIHGKPLPFLIECYCKEKSNNSNNNKQQQTTMGLKEGKSLKVVSPVKGSGKPANYVIFKTLVWVSRIQLSLFYYDYCIYYLLCTKHVYSLPNFLCWSRKCHYNGIWRYVVVEHLGGREGGVLMNGISALVRRDLGETIFVFPHKRTQLKVAFVQTRKKILTWTHWLIPKSWIFQLPELWIINVCCLNLPVYDICYCSPN